MSSSSDEVKTGCILYGALGLIVVIVGIIRFFMTPSGWGF